MDKNKLKMLVDYAVREGNEHTTDGPMNLVSLMGCKIYDEHDEAPAETLSDDDLPQVPSM